MIGLHSDRLPRVILILAAVLLFTAANSLAQGQGQGGGAGRGQGQGQGQRGQGRQGMGQALIDRMHTAVNELGLTDEQKPKIDAIFAKAKDDFAAKQPEWQNLEPQERMQQSRAFTQQLVTDVRAELNDEQKAKFDDRVQQLQQRGGGGGQGAGMGGQNRRMREALDSLGLTDEQKPKVEAILKEMDDKVQQAQQESQGDREAMREKSRMIAQDTVAQLEKVLTPEQTQQLRETMRQARGTGQGDGQGRGRRADAPGGPATRPSDGGMSPSTQPSNENKPGAMLMPDANSPGAPPGALGRLAVGHPAPDWQIKKLDGSPVQLSSFKDKLVLVAFGSYSSPSFRQRVFALDDLRREYSTKISCVIVYTREAHPAGAWEVERNRDEEISIADHKNEDERRDIAKRAKDRLKLGSFTFTIDSMDDATAKSYHATPNTAAVLIGRDGTVLAYQQWFDAYTMREAIIDALANKSPSASATR